MSARRRSILRRFVAKAGGQPKWMEPLEAPRWLSAAQAAGTMRPEDAVLGLEFDGRAWALPWWIMKNHHVANLELGDRPVMVTLCEICSSAAAMDPVIDGRRHRFRLAGIYNGTIMPTDDETGSLWTGFTGESIDGPLQGRTLQRLALWQATWSEWVTLHPDTRVAEGRDEPRGGHGEGQTPGSPVVGESMRALLAHVDRRLPHHELVLGVRAGRQARCYPLARLEEHGPVLNDALGREKIAIFSRPATWMALAYSRELNGGKLDGKHLDFRADDGEIVDVQTGSRWTLGGVASAGPLAGSRLRYVHSGIEEFYIWAAFHPGTRIHPAKRHTPKGKTRGAPRLWSVDLVPDVLHKAIRKWRESASQVLYVGCGEGMSAAWAAERGLNVHAVDADPDLIARARRSFRGAVRLAWEAADLRRPHAFAQQFDAVIDHGYFARLSAGERAGYVSNLRSAARNGAILLLLVPCGKKNLARLARQVRQALRPEFKVLGMGRRPLALPGGNRLVASLTFRARRREARRER